MRAGRRGGKSIRIGSEVTVRRTRGPREADGLYYWRAERYDPVSQRRTTFWTGWGDAVGVEETITRMVFDGSAKGGDDRPDPIRLRSVRDLLECWIGTDVDGRADLADSTKKNYRSKVRPIAREIGHAELSALDGGLLAHYAQKRLRAGTSTGQVKSELSHLCIAWAWAKRLGFVQGELVMPRLRHRPAHDKQTPTPEEFWRVMDALDAPPWARLALEVLAGTGARIGAVAALTWGRVDLDRGEVHFDWKGRGRDVTLGPATVELLRGVRPADVDPDRRVLEGATELTVRKYLAVYIDRACGVAGVKRFTPHGIRRMVIDQYYERGADVGVVAAQMGQSPQVALQYYRQARPKQRREAVALAGLGERPKK